MESSKVFLLQEVIDDLINVDKTLTSPLLKLNYFAQLVKNTPLVTYTTREMEGYRTVEDSEIPEYRKTPGTLYLDLSSLGGATATHAASASLLGQTEYEDNFRYIIFREGIATIEHMVKDWESGGSKDQYIESALPFEILSSFEKGIRKRNPRIPIRVTGARILGNAYKVTEILSIVRARLMTFTMEVAEQFGVQIEISSFNKHKETNNQAIYHIMNKTEITNTGDGNVVNTGNNATQAANVSINKGDWNSLRNALKGYGVEESDIKELKTIVDNDSAEGDKIGSKTLDWILKVSGKAIQGVGKIAIGVTSALLATLIKGYIGL